MVRFVRSMGEDHLKGVCCKVRVRRLGSTSGSEADAFGSHCHSG